jgi:HK97 family phage portal protein
VSLVRRALAATERRSAPEFGDSTPPPPGLSAISGAAGMSESGALQVLAVFGSVGVIADGIASLPWQRFSSPDPAKRRPLPLTQILKQPYIEISRTDWLTQYAMSMALRGNFYGQVLERDQDFFPTQIKPVHPDQAQVRRLADGRVEYRFNRQPVPLDNVFHIRYLAPAGSLVGLNPVENLRVSLSLARAQDLYGAAYFDNSANPEGVIETDDELEDDEVLALAQRWIAAHGGVGKAHLPAVLTGGAKFSPISINPRDSQFLESRQYSASTISGMVFRVPPHMIGIVDRTTSWGKGIEQQERGFVTNTLGGYIGRLEEAIDALHPGDEYCRLNLSQRLRGDKLTRSQAHALDLAAGWISLDEVRAEEDMAPIPDGLGANHFTPINSELLAQATQSVKDSEATPAVAPADPTGETGGADA